MNYKDVRIEISIIVISYNTCQYTLNCIKSIYETASDLNLEIILVDNASSDDTVELVKKEFPNVITICNSKNLGYAAAVNIGVQKSKGNYLIISNNDIIYHRDSINSLITRLKNHPLIGVAGPQQEYPDGSWQYCYGDFPGIKLGFKKFSFVYSIEQILRSKLYKFSI